MFLFAFPDFPVAVYLFQGNPVCLPQELIVVMAVIVNLETPGHQGAGLTIPLALDIVDSVGHLFNIVVFPQLEDRVFQLAQIGVVGSIASAGSAFTPAAGDTTLTGSYFGDNFDTNTVADKQNQYELLLSVSEGNAELQSIGIFNAGGELFAEDTFTSINKTGSMEVQFDINLTYADL